MAFSTNVVPNLIDWSRIQDPDGEVADLAYLLAQTNDILKDMIFQQGNMPLGHKVSANVGLPQGTWRGNNQGVPSTKGTFAQYQFSIGELVDYSLLDRSEAELGGNLAKTRWTFDNVHVEGLGQQVAAAMFYSNEAINPQQFTGLAPYYNSVSTSNAMSAANVIDCGGTGSSNASMWMVNWGDNETFSIFPEGSQAGLIYEDKGDVRALYDTNGNQYEGYTSYFCWKVGLAVKNWKYNVRLANIDVTSAGLAGSAPPDLNVYLSEAANKPPTSTARVSGITESDAPGDPVPGTNTALYMNRTVKTGLEVQAIRDKNVLISMTEYAGKPVLEWRGIPCRVVDALTNSEARVV